MLIANTTGKVYRLTKKKKKGKKTTFSITYKPQIIQTKPPSRWYNLCVAYWDFDAAEYTVKFNKIKNA